MPYRFRTSDADLTAGVRRIALEQIDRALAELNDPDLDPAAAVHAVRKRIKKLRGLIRLVRPGFAAFDAENAALRDAARRLSGLRDRDVMLATHDALVAGDAELARRARPVRTWLAKRKLPADAAEAEAARAGFAADLRALRARAEGWEVAGKDARIIADGLERNLDKARRTMAAAEDSLDDAHLHDWRKYVKYHWYQAQLLRPIRPDRLQARIDAAEALGEDLGAHHDLTVYADTLAAAEVAPRTRRVFDEMETLARRRQEEIEDRALAAGRAMLNAPPEKVARRWRGWWKDWRAA